jgi:hypothetical protein
MSLVDSRPKRTSRPPLLETSFGDWALAENIKRLTEEIYVEQSADDSFSPRPKAVDSEALLERIL